MYNRLNGKRDEVRLLRRALIESGVEYKCQECGIGDVWNGQKIVLEVHHKDEDFLNNVKENLEFLCPNCHSQKNKKIRGTNRLPYLCKCGKNIAKRLNGSCRSCGAKKRKIISPLVRKRKVENRPSKEELKRMVSEMPMTRIGEKYGVSSNAVKKWCKSYGIQLENRLGFWTKKKGGLIERISFDR